MDGNYDIHGAMFSDPIVTVRDFSCGDGVFIQNTLIEDEEDSISFDVAGTPPAKMDEQSRVEWVVNELQQYKIN